MAEQNATTLFAQQNVADVHAKLTFFAKYEAKYQGE